MSTALPEQARIRYRRPGRDTVVFTQRVAHRDPRAIVTLLESADRSAPLRIAGRCALGARAPIVWLTVPGAWYDVGRFHDDRGTFTGFYTNILTPPDFHGPGEWSTTDLFLDVWQPIGAPPILLDVDELDAAVSQGTVDAADATRARAEAARILNEARDGRWPPAAILAWPLRRVARTLGLGRF